MRVVGRFAAALAVVAIAAASVEGQSWRTLESSRQLRDSGEHRVRVEYGAGRLDVSSTFEPVLYSMVLRYDETLGSAVHLYEPEQRTLTLGLGDLSVRFSRNVKDQTRGEMRLALSRAVPMDLAFDLGATKASLELGGLALRNLRIQSGAGEAFVAFGSPNPLPMRALEIEVGAASLQVRDLANANTSSVRVKGGVGSIDLGFAGQWSQDMAVDADVTFGKLTLHVPRDVGVQVRVQRFLASFDHEGLTKRGDSYYSENWETARYRLRLHASATIGGIELDRADR